jgi:hypothetical protein
MVFSVNGRSMSGRQIGIAIRDAFHEEYDQTVDTLEQDLKDFIKKLDSASTNRGTGNGSGIYNRPFRDTVVIRTKSSGKTLLSVEGRVFNILDKGARSRRAKGRHYMSFPRYTGNLTSPDSLDLGSVSISDTEWVRNRVVAPIAPRHFLEAIVKRRKFKRVPRKRSSNPFRWKFSPNEVTVEVVD